MYNQREASLKGRSPRQEFVKREKMFSGQNAFCFRVVVVGATFWNVLFCAYADEPDLIDLEEKAQQAAAETVAPSVVRIETFAGLERKGRLTLGDAPTTGLVVSEDGYIISSAFNFISKPDSILVTLHDGRRLAAREIARDHSRKLVLLKVDSDSKLPVPHAVAKSDMVPGQWAIALGRTFDPKQVNLSIGIISATGRIWDKAVQTDAKISPSNYGGPLVNLRGEVFGVLVPLAPQGGTEVAGAEWYDSGIGFAVPLIDIFAKLEQLKSGQDLQRGIMGITLKGSDLYGGKAEVAVCQRNSPADLAGIKVGDQITRINDMPIDRQAHLKHALGPLYAGDLVRVTLRRGEEELSVDIVLVEKLPPHEHPFLGIMPARTSEECVVQSVVPDSPAAKAGMQDGDQIMKLDDEEIKSSDDLRNKLDTNLPGDTVVIVAKRAEEEIKFECVLAKLPTDMVETDPRLSEFDTPAEESQRGIVEVKLPEESRECFAYVPEDYDSRLPHGLVVWLLPPGPFDKAKLTADWDELARKHDLIILAPRPEDSQRWERTEIAFVRKTIEQVAKTYTVDVNRTAVSGRKSGGAMAFLTGITNRDIVRGIAMADAVVPFGIPLPETEPLKRLAFLLTTSADYELKPSVEKLVADLTERKFPVTRDENDTKATDDDDATRETIARWVDSLDRI